jgi:chromosomal replication initiator protein
LSLIERLHAERKERLARLGAAPERPKKLDKVLIGQSELIDEIRRDAPDIVAEWVKRQKIIADDLRTAVLDAGHIRPSVAAIQAAVAKYFNVGVTDLLSGRRHKDVILPRHIAFYLCRKLTLQSLPDIGRRFGGRDHTTAMHAVAKVTGLLEKDPSIAAAIESIKQELRVAE